MQKPYQVNILFAGFDDRAGASLYWMDYLATMHKMNIAGTGYGALDWYLLYVYPHAAADQHIGDCRFILCVSHARQAVAPKLDRRGSVSVAYEGCR